MMFYPHSRCWLQQSQRECCKFFPKRTKNAIRGGKDSRKDMDPRDREHLTHQVQTLRVLRNNQIILIFYHHHRRVILFTYQIDARLKNKIQFKNTLILSSCPQYSLALGKPLQFQSAGISEYGIKKRLCRSKEQRIILNFLA